MQCSIAWCILTSQGTIIMIAHYFRWLSFCYPQYSRLHSDALVNIQNAMPNVTSIAKCNGTLKPSKWKIIVQWYSQMFTANNSGWNLHLLQIIDTKLQDKYPSVYSSKLYICSLWNIPHINKLNIPNYINLYYWTYINTLYIYILQSCLCKKENK